MLSRISMFKNLPHISEQCCLNFGMVHMLQVFKFYWSFVCAYVRPAVIGCNLVYVVFKGIPAYMFSYNKWGLCRLLGAGGKRTSHFPSPNFLPHLSLPPWPTFCHCCCSSHFLSPLPAFTALVLLPCWLWLSALFHPSFLLFLIAASRFPFPPCSLSPFLSLATTSAL